MEKIAVIYWSGTGNTYSMANEIVAGLHENTDSEVDIFSVDSFKGDINNYSKIAFGCPSMGDEVLEESEFDPFFENIENDLGNKKIALFGSFGWGDGKWMRDWEERVVSKGGKLYDEGLIINGSPDGDGINLCNKFGKGFASF